MMLNPLREIDFKALTMDDLRMFQMAWPAISHGSPQTAMESLTAGFARFLMRAGAQEEGEGDDQNLMRTWRMDTHGTWYIVRYTLYIEYTVHDDDDDDDEDDDDDDDGDDDGDDNRDDDDDDADNDDRLWSLQYYCVVLVPSKDICVNYGMMILMIRWHYYLHVQAFFPNRFGTKVLDRTSSMRSACCGMPFHSGQWFFHGLIWPPKLLQVVNSGRITLW